MPSNRNNRRTKDNGWIPMRNARGLLCTGAAMGGRGRGRSMSPYQLAAEMACWAIIIRQYLRKRGTATSGELAAACSLRLHSDADPDERSARMRHRDILRRSSEAFGIIPVGQKTTFEGGTVWGLAPDPSCDAARRSEKTAGARRARLAKDAGASAPSP